MDSKKVNREIRVKVWPQLRSWGFSEFTSRTAWRHRPIKIDVINFQSFNSYLAGSLGCTTYSFAINLGCYFLDIPIQFKPGIIKEKDGRLLPLEYHCHLRRSLKKSLRQRESPRLGIWYVDPQGENLSVVIQDAIKAIQGAASWFEKYDSRDSVLHELVHGRESEWGTFGYGSANAPIRSFLIGHMALATNDHNLARKHLTAALDSGLYSNNAATMRLALQHLAEPGG